MLLIMPFEDWAYAQCGNLRIDTHGDNTVMQNLMKKAGLTRCGTIYVVEDHDCQYKCNS